jgi:hypothetical protein
LFEALLVATDDAYKRASSTDPKALADAIRTTNIADNVSISSGIQFNAKGQSDKVKDGAIQNLGGKNWRRQLLRTPGRRGRRERGVCNVRDHVHMR